MWSLSCDRPNSFKKNCISVWCFSVNVREITKETHTHTQRNRQKYRSTHTLTVRIKFRDEFLFLMFDFDLLYLMCTTERMSSTLFFLFDLLPVLTSNKIVSSWTWDWKVTKVSWSLNQKEKPLSWMHLSQHFIILLSSIIPSMFWCCSMSL